MTGGDNGGHDCPTGIVNQTGYGLQPISASKWDTDTWNPVPDPDRAVSSFGDTQSENYESDGGFLRGCSNTVVWDLVLDPNDPARHILPDGNVHGHRHLRVERGPEQDLRLIEPAVHLPGRGRRLADPPELVRRGRL